jgi:ABC-type nitrate/sulfonate/bicarbonate transport system permease component
MWRDGVNMPGTLTLLALAALWEAAVRFHAIEFDYLPAPSAIAAALVDVVRSGELLADTAHTMRSVVIGWLIASAIGIALGLLFGFSAFARRNFLASFEILRPLPSIAFLPVALLLFSFSLTTELIVIVYASIWPIFVNTMGGIQGVATRLHEVSRTLRLSRVRTLGTVLIPAAAPAIVVGCRLAMGTTLVMAIIAEMLGNPHGLGYAIVDALQAIQPARMFAYVLFTGVLAITLNAALVAVSRRMLRNHSREAAGDG